MLGDEPDNLPLLEHALHELWLRRQGPLLTFGTYRAIGGIRGAIAERARHAYRSLPPAQQGAARRLLVSLVTPGEGREDTRARIPMPDDPDEREVIRRFSAKENRLLVTDTDPRRQPTVEVSHEALIRNWKELREWVDEIRGLLRIRVRIRTDMARWKEHKRPASLLLQSGLPLAEARRLLEKHEHIVIDDLRPYIQTSLKRDTRRWRGTFAVLAFGFLSIAAIAVYFYELQSSEAQARAAAEQAQAEAAREADRATAELRRAVETDGRRLTQIAGRYLQSGRPHQAIMVAREAFGPLKEDLPFQERPMRAHRPVMHGRSSGSTLARTARRSRPMPPILSTTTSL